MRSAYVRFSLNLKCKIPHICLESLFASGMFAFFVTHLKWQAHIQCTHSIPTFQRIFENYLHDTHENDSVEVCKLLCGLIITNCCRF